MALAVCRAEHLDRVVVAALMSAAAALLFGHHAYLSAEISLSALLLRLTGPDTPPEPWTTPGFTSAFLVLPLLLVSAVVIALRPRTTRRVLSALGAAVLVVVAAHQLRVLALGRWPGAGTGHHWLGPVIAALGVAAALVAFARLATRR